jgi:CsoR family transcriptional regulator, copper-sensing transcriptional repressor
MIKAYPIPLEGMSSHKRKDVARRISRIHGHVHGIAEMLEDGRPYSEIVHQISAVRASLESATQVIVEDIVEDCVGKAAAKKPVTGSLEELQRVVAEIR